MEQIQSIPLDQIQTASQVRTHFDEQAIQGLALSLKEVGQLQPIRVRRVEDGFVIVDGERRYRATLKAGLATIAVIIEDKELNEGNLIQRQLIANCQREALSPLEKARALHQLMTATGWNAKQVAGSLGMSRAMVTRLLSLLNLPEELQHKVAQGEITVSAAYELTQVPDPRMQESLASALAEGRLNRDGISHARKRGNEATTKRPGNASRVTALLGDGRSFTMTAPGLDLESFIGSLEELLAKARKVRPQGVSLKTFITMLKEQAGGPQENRVVVTSVVKGGLS